MNFDTEWARLNRAQHILNYAWAFGLLGLFSTILLRALNVKFGLVVNLWLGLCFVGCVVALVRCMIAYWSGK